MSSLEDLPKPPRRPGWWDEVSLSRYVNWAFPRLVHEALHLRDDGGTLADWIYLAKLHFRLALRAWKEIQKGE